MSLASRIAELAGEISYRFTQVPSKISVACAIDAHPNVLAPSGLGEVNGAYIDNGDRVLVLNDGPYCGVWVARPSIWLRAKDANDSGLLTGAMVHVRKGPYAGTVWVSTGDNSYAGPWQRVELTPFGAPDPRVPTGALQMWPAALTAVPAGYLPCDGRTFSSATYPALATRLGDTYGTHVGTNYYLPDFRGRSPIGVGSAVPAVGGNTYTVGQKFGHEQMQAHNHSGATTTESNYHSHPTPSHAIYGVAGGNLGTAGIWNQGASGTGYNSQLHTHIINTDGTGNAGNVHPVLAINYIIKT